MSTLQVNDFVFVKAPSGDHFGQIIEVKPGIGEGKFVYRIRHFSDDVVRSIAGGYCTKADKDSIILFREKARKEMEAKFDKILLELDAQLLPKHKDRPIQVGDSVLFTSYTEGFSRVFISGVVTFIDNNCKWQHGTTTVFYIRAESGREYIINHERVKLKN